MRQHDGEQTSQPTPTQRTVYATLAPSKHVGGPPRETPVHGDGEALVRPQPQATRRLSSAALSKQQHR